MPYKILTPLLNSANQKGVGTSDFSVSLKRELGRGAQGRVMEAVLNYSNYHNYRCAAKYTFFRKQEPKPDQEKSIHQLITDPNIRSGDCGILRHIGSANLVNKNKKVSLSLTPLCDMTLSNCLKDIVDLKCTNQPLHKLLVFHFFTSIINGLSHLARYKIIHCDLKPENIGFYETWCMFDFDSSRTYDSFVTSSAQGSYLYMAPEIVFGDKRFPEMGDIWSVGQILRELLGMELVTFLKPSQELHSSSLAWAKAEAYSKIKEAELTEDLILYQIHLKNKVCSSTSFAECLNFLMESMSQTSPCLRPNLETLKLANEHLSSFQREYASLNEKDQFYEKMIKKYSEQQAHERPEPSLSVFDDNYFSPDADDLSVLSMSPLDTF